MREIEMDGEAMKTIGDGVRRRGEEEEAGMEQKAEEDTGMVSR